MTCNIKNNFSGVKLTIISWRFAAAPVRALSIVYNEINESPMTRVFVAPSKNINSSGDFVLVIVLPIIAACPEPSPGKKLQSGETIIEPINGLNDFIFGKIILWGGIFVLLFMLIIKLEIPNKPVSNGKRGSFIWEFNTKNPSVPVNAKTIIAENFFLSIKIKNIEMEISICGIIVLVKLNIIGNNFTNGKAKKIIRIVEINPPYAASIIAL